MTADARPAASDLAAVPPPGEHGGDQAAVAAALGIGEEELLDLSVSMNPVAPDPLPVLARHLGSLRRYPDPASATQALAEAVGIEADRVLLTNGGSEAIALVAAELGEGFVEEPEFSLYRRHLRKVVPGAPRWRSNPRNPTGELADPAERAAVWDEAFYPLATGRFTRGDAERGAFVVGSLTKLFSCPGLRVGYVLAPDPDAARRLAARQPAWALNGLAAAALPELLARLDLEAVCSAVAALRAELVALLRAHGLAPAPSAANFVLVPAPAGFREALALEGVLVRDCSSFGLAGWYRVAVPNASGLERLKDALGPALARLGAPGAGSPTREPAGGRAPFLGGPSRRAEGEAR